MALTDEPIRRVVHTRSSLRNRVKEVIRYRELLFNLIRKELRVKYKNSSLGFLWSLLNPALTLTVYYVVFQLILKNATPYFPIYLMSGLLVWNLFAGGLGSATGAITANSGLVKKVRFPREILPLANVGVGLVDLALQSTVLVILVAVLRYKVALGAPMLLIPLAIVVLVVLLTALAVVVSAVNVYMRDMEHLIQVLLMLWFWSTPVIYPYKLVAGRIGNFALLNPVTSVVLAFQRVIYNDPVRILGSDPGLWWFARNLLIVGFGATLLLLLASRVFARLEGNFAEEL